MAGRTLTPPLTGLRARIVPGLVGGQAAEAVRRAPLLRRPSYVSLQRVTAHALTAQTSSVLQQAWEQGRHVLYAHHKASVAELGLAVRVPPGASLLLAAGRCLLAVRTHAPPLATPLGDFAPSGAGRAPCDVC